MSKMYVTIVECEANIIRCGSLKEKRSIVQGAKSRIKRKFENISIAEISKQDSLDSVCLGVAVVCSSMAVAQRIAQALENWFYEYEDFISADVSVDIV